MTFSEINLGSMLPDIYSIAAKIPPQAKDVEEVVLGTMMMDYNSITTILSVLRDSDMFYVNAHRLVHSAIVNLFSKQKPVDILTVTEELKGMGKLEDVGGAFYVTELTSRVYDSKNCEAHAHIVKEKWIQRERIRMASETIKEAYEDTNDPHDGIGDDVDKFNNLLNQITAGSSKSFKNHVDAAFTDIALISGQPKSEHRIVGLSTGNAALDQLSQGFKDSNFVVLSGRPGHGKTSLEVASALRNAKLGVPVGIFSLEMSAKELILKLISIESGVDINSIIKAELSPNEEMLVSNARDLIRELPINIYDRGEEDGITMRDISAIAKGWKAKFGTRIFFIDYLQLIISPNQAKNGFSNREQDVSEISRSCKRLAKRLDCPIVGISSLSRNLERRTNWDKRPIDADLREGGSIEYDADVIIHIFRPENVQLEFYSNDGLYNDGGSTKDTIEFDVSKNKLGRRGRIRQKVNNGTGELRDYFIEKITYEPKQKPMRNYYEKPEKDDEETPF